MKVGINPSGDPARRIESAHWNHHESSTGKIDFQSPRDSDVVAHARKGIPGKGPIEVRGAINNQGFTMLLKHLLLQNGDGCGLTATINLDSALPLGGVARSAENRDDYDSLSFDREVDGVGKSASQRAANS